MNCHEFQERLPDYVARELSATDQAAAEAHCIACTGCARAAAELAATERLLRSGVVEPAVAEAAVRDLEIPLATGRRALALRTSAAPLRYAAVIALGFFAGYAMHGQPAADPRPPNAPGVVQLASAEPVNPALVSRYQAAQAAYPDASAFSRSLLTLARP